MLCLITQLCQTLCDPMDYNLPGSSVHKDSGFSRQEYLSGLPCPPPMDLLNTGLESRSPATRVDSLPSVTRKDLESFMFHHKYFSYFCFNYFDIFINVFSRIYFLLCLMFKHFCPNNFNLLKVLQKLVYTLHFPIN